MQGDDFPIRRVDSSQPRALETIGSKPKFWFLDGEQRLLFKADDRGTGEDWAEVVVSHLCGLLGLPHVQYELAVECNGENPLRPGVVCANMAPAPNWLVLGNQLLLARDPDYPTAQQFKVRQHTIEAIAGLVRLLHPPASHWCINVPVGVTQPMDFFAGYLMLDAWVANQDRHHENWAAIWHNDSPMMWLAPTFDHGASLARNLSDQERAERLSARDRNRTVERFVERARGAIFACVDDHRPMGLVEAFQAFGRLAPSAARAWLDRLASLDIGNVEAIVNRVPAGRMSDVTKSFTVRLLEVNQQRLVALTKDYQ